MKKLLQTFLYYLLFCLTGFSQNDSLMPNKYGSFSIRFSDWGIPDSYQTLTIVGTAEENIVALKNGTTPIAYLLLDSNKVYVKKSEYYISNFTLADTFDLLYDFDWKIGDFVYQDKGTLAYVIEIDTLVFSGVKRKRFKLTNNEEIIQGIGSNRHPLQSRCTLIEGIYNVCSVQLEYTGTSPLDILNYQFQCTAGLEEEPSSLQEQIFPNPVTSGSLKILPVHQEKPASILIFDCFGREINVLIQSNQTKDEINVDVSALTSGVYFIKIDSITGTRSYSVIIDNF